MTDHEPATKVDDSIAPATPPAARLTLGVWSYYFIAKLLMLWRGLIGLHPLENLAFAALLAVPLPSKRLRVARTVAAIPAAIALLYYDSFLPPFSRLLAQMQQVSNFGLSYLIELAGRFIQWQMVAVLVLGWALCRIASSYVRLGLLTVVALCLVGAQQGRSNTEPAPVAAVPAQSAGAAAGDTPDLALQQFFASEGKRRVTFKAPADSSTPFDVVFIHICSLSWDDLQAVGLDQHPLLRQADMLFHHFNSAASYSGPAAIRFLRGPCGQQRHADIYQPSGDQCYLMPSLEKSGFTPQLAMNHDGHFDDFLQLLRKQGLAAQLQSLAGAPVPQRAFDDSAVYDDSAILGRWLEARQHDSAARVALFYNTISLHDGNRLQAGPGAGKESSAIYQLRVGKLLDDIQQFIGQLERSGRRTVVFVVPEHGGAYRGDKMQVAGLREIPTPAITNVPVVVKVIGPGVQAVGGTAHVNDAASYLAISQIVATMIDKPPFDPAGFSPAEYVNNLPVTPYVAENEGSVMLEHRGKFMLRLGSDPWKIYDTTR